MEYNTLYTILFKGIYNTPFTKISHCQKSNFLDNIVTITNITRKETFRIDFISILQFECTPEKL